jgi:hypothetical protein
MAIPVTFVAGDILEAQQLNDNFDAVYAGYTSFTPTIGGWTQGNATFVSQYAVNGESVHYFGYFLFGSTSAVTATALTVSLPLTANVAPNSLGLATFSDDSAASTVAGYVQTVSTTVMNFYWLDPEAAPIAVRLEPWRTGVTLPFTFATGDYVYWDLTYRKA